jgi:hypothetical protein
VATPNICVINTEKDGFVYFTVTKSYTISRSATVTDFTIESGKKVTDHHVADNKRFSFSGFVTTASVIGGGNIESSVTPSSVFTKLDKLMESGETFTFVSDSELSFSETPHCVLVSYSVNRDDTMGSGVEVSVDIRQIQFVDSLERLSAKQAKAEKVDQAEAESNLGPQTTESTILEKEKELVLKEKAGFSFF